MSAPLFTNTVTTCPVMINLPSNDHGYPATTACGQPSKQSVVSTLGDGTVLNVCANHAASLVESGDAVPA